MPEDNRGRNQAPKPLVAPAAATRVKGTFQAQDSATASAENQPSVSTSASSTPGDAALKAGARGTTPEGYTKLRSQPLRAPSLKGEPLQVPPITKDTAENATSSEGAPFAIEPIRGTESISEPPVPQTEALEPSKITESLLSPQPEATPSLEPPPGSDSMHVPAQTYPWLYMNSTLDACFANEEPTVKGGPGKEKEQITGLDGAQLTDSEPQQENEKVIKFSDEPGSDVQFAKEAPTIMQSFISFSEVCERVEAEALQLAMSTPSLESREPLEAFIAMMDNLDSLQEQASELESSILRLTGSSPIAVPSDREIPESSQSNVENLGDREPQPDNEEIQGKKQQLLEDANSARAQMLGVFAACLPVLRARIANLSMAQELIDSAQENFSLALRMESMGIE